MKQGNLFDTQNNKNTCKECKHANAGAFMNTINVFLIVESERQAERKTDY